MSTVIPVTPNNRVSFHCRLCANCCRDLEDQLLVTPLDAYQLARFLRAKGEAASIGDIYERYTHPDILVRRLPVYLMNTVGLRCACVFLKDGRCAAYDGRPYTCRTYPFSVNSDARGIGFEFYQCMDRHKAHFSDGKVLVSDWFNQNFSKEDREYMTAEETVMRGLGLLLLKLDDDSFLANAAHIFHFRYYNYDLDQPFMQQYTRNMAVLTDMLQNELGEA